MSRLRWARAGGAAVLGVVLAGAPVGAEAPLSFHDAVDEALRRSPALAKARLEVATRELDEPRLLAETDPQFSAGYLWSDDQSPRAQPAFQGTRSERETTDLGILQRTLIGTEARLNWRNERLRNPSTFRPLDPTVDSRLALNVRQPLLRYFWGRPDKARRGLFRSGVSAARERLRHQEIETAAAVTRVYVRAHVAERSLGIAEQALAAARDLERSYAEKRRYGLVEESDFFQASVSVQVQETELTLARAELENARHALRAALSRHTPDRPEPLALDDPPELLLTLSSEEEVVRAALDHRPDVGAARASRQAAEWGLRTEVLDSLPDLAFLGSYALAGLDTDASGAWKDLRARDHPVRSAGVNLTVPFGSKKEKLDREGGRLRREAARQDVEQAVQRALSEARQAWLGLDTARARLTAMERLVDLEGRKMASEEAQFGRGRSSTDLLVRFRQDLYRAQRQRLQARADDVAARVEVGRATGTLLEMLTEGRRGGETGR